MTVRAVRHFGLVIFMTLATAVSQLVASGAKAQGESQLAPTYPTELSGRELSGLVRRTFVAVDNANSTDNYTVLRDLSAQTFKQETMAEFRAIFSPLRTRQIDLASAVLQDPRIVAAAMKIPGVLGVSGFLTTEPELTTFRLLYRYEEGGWRIGSVTIGQRAPFLARDADTGGIKPAEFSPALSVSLTPDKPFYPDKD